MEGQGNTSELILNYISKSSWSEIVTQLPSKIHFYKQISDILFNYVRRLEGCQNKQIVISTSLFYFHRYSISVDSNLTFLFNAEDTSQSTQSVNPELLILTWSSFFIASKATNNFIHLDTLVNNIYDMLKKTKKNNNENSMTWEYNRITIKEKILNYEYNILVSLGFDSNFDLPYKFNQHFREILGKHTKNSNIEKIRTIIIFHINDTFTLPLSVRYTPYMIAVACFKQVVQKLKLEIDINKEFDCDGIEEDIEDIANIMNFFYSVWRN